MTVPGRAWTWRLRGAAGLAAAALLVLVPARAALAVPVLDAADATELADQLDEATEVQGICYGWRASVTDPSATDGVDEGSSNGMGQALDTAACPRYIQLDATITYTSEMSEAEDSASWSIQSNIAGAPTTADLDRLGMSANGLLSERDDEALTNAVLALPLLASQKGLAPALQLEPNATPIPGSDHPTGSPANDFMRGRWPLMALLVLLIAGGLVGVLIAVRSRSRSRVPATLPSLWTAEPPHQPQPSPEPGPAQSPAAIPEPPPAAIPVPEPPPAAPEPEPSSPPDEPRT